MDLKISKYRIYLHQFSNIVLGTSIVALLLSMPTTAAGLDRWIHQIFIFLVTFLVVFHCWWRNAELFTTGKSKTAGVYSIGIVKIALILMSILWLRSVSEMANPQNIHFQIFFGIVNIVLWGGLLQQTIFLKPLYGKARILQKRELLTDLFFAFCLTLFLFGFVFLPEYVFGKVGFAVFAVIVLLSRPLAKALTPWTELAPPHRGGRGRQDRSRQNDSRSTSSQSRYPKRERSFDDRGRKRSHGNRNRQSGSNRTRSNRTTGPEQRRKEPSNSKVIEEQAHHSNPPSKTRNANRDNNEKQNAEKGALESRKQQFGRNKRGRRQKPDQNNIMNGQEKVSESDTTTSDHAIPLSQKESSNTMDSEKKDKNVTQYGRKKVRARARLGQKNKPEKESDKSTKNQELSKEAAAEHSN